MRHYIKAVLGSGIVAASLIVAALGCSQQSAQGDSSSTPQATLASSAQGHSLEIDTSKYILAEEPDGAIGVISARADSKDGDEVVLLGRVGGSKKPWIEGRSAFLVIDASKMLVADGEDSGGSEICLDDCCASLRAECTTLVKVVDDHGSVLPVDGRQLLNANVGDLVVVRGRIQRDAKEGTFVVIANGVHVRR